MCRCAPLQEEGVSDGEIIKDTIEVTGDIDDEEFLWMYFEGPKSGENRQKTIVSVTLENGVAKVKFSCDEGITFFSFYS